jgi:ATP/maltotriose-dependent transcriptional regulator MalT
LAYPLSGSAPVERQWLRFLANRETHLLLDNFEHLLTSSDFMAELLAQASGAKYLIAEGQTNQAITDKLFLSPGTVKWYSSEIYGKLGVANRTRAVAEARRLKLFE